ncbi:MAG: hypothetical protein JWO22_491 [Frankiales bacterium]|nr:hypothetical protein [Frankiales bacterium]
MSTRSIRKVGAATALVASGLVAGGVLAGSMTANAAETTRSYGSASGSTTTAPAKGASSDTAVTGTTADQVKAAVKAKYSTVTITTVRKDPDGSYDALGTDASGNSVFYDVSADLKTVTAGAGGGHRGGGGGASKDTAVTGTEATDVKAAVKAKYSTVTITTVRKDADGSYDALGTDASGNSVFYDVSKDLKTVTANAGGRGHGSGTAPAPSASSSTSG